MVAMALSEVMQKREWTLQEWLEAEMEPRCELENGRLIPMASPTRQHQRIVGRLFAQMDHWASQTSSGFVEMELDVALPTGIGCIPDLVFIRRERASELYTPEGKIKGVPDLVVEVVSPSTRARDTVHKLRVYQAAGVPWYGLIDSETLMVQELRLAPDGYQISVVADAGEVFRPAALPGFELNLQALLEG
jgi:Uma2 family endonuclease